MKTPASLDDNAVEEQPGTTDVVAPGSPTGPVSDYNEDKEDKQKKFTIDDNANHDNIKTFVFFINFIFSCFRLLRRTVARCWKLG